MNASADWKQSESRRKLVGFVGRLRRRFFLVTFAGRWLIAAPVCGVMLVPVSVLSDIEAEALAWFGLAASVLVAVLLAIRGRQAFAEYVELADRHFDAAGRIVAAVEFIKKCGGLGPFERLAIEDAVSWIKEHPRKGLPWRLRFSVGCAARVSVCILILQIAGCEGPQRISEREARYQPEQSTISPVERSEEAKPRPSVVGKAASQPAEVRVIPEEESDAALKPAKNADGHDSMTGMNKTVQTKLPGLAPTSAPTDEPENLKMTETPSPSASGEQAAPDPPPTKPKETPTGSASRAGTQDAEQKPEQREVGAPQEEVQAREAASEENAALGPEVEGAGEDYTEAGAPVATQPVESVDYRDARRQDLTRERVSPARRALIERYFRKLQQQNNQTPTSQPASQPTTQTTRKAS